MRMAAAGAAPLDARGQATVRAIEDLVESARDAVRRKRRLPWRSLLDRWRGTSIEHAYQSLHAARVFLVDLLPPDEVDAVIPSAIARVATCLGPADVRRLKIDSLASERHLGRKRAGLRQAMEISYDASDQLHARVRGFRNILVSAAVLIAVFMIALVLIVSLSPAAMPLCFTPTITSAETTQGEATRTVCPSGEDPKGAVPSPETSKKPEKGDVAIIAGLGLLGGALAAAFAIRNIRGTSTPYDVPIAVAWLKVPSGSLTAVAGILLLGGGFVPGLSELDSQRQILAYALVFGYAQQLATRFIDNQAQSVLGDVPSKDLSGRQPTAPVPQAGPPPPPPPAEDRAADREPAAESSPRTRSAARPRLRIGRRRR
jgi:hypothetical protein